MKSLHARLGLILLLVGAIGLLGYYFVAPWLEDFRQRRTSDAAETKGKIVIAMDSWVGYFPLCSPRMKQGMRSAGYLLKCENDQADYPERMRRLRAGEIDFAVATVDSYILNGEPENFPGTIVMIIDESKGGDAVVARAEVVSDIDDLKTVEDLKIAFTPGSPSEHLLKSIGAHFDIPRLRSGTGPWRVETNGSEEALSALQKGRVDVAVLWEPHVSRALAGDGVAKLLGTEDTDKLIVDILVVNRGISEDRPETVSQLLSTYFRTLKHYRDRPEQLKDEIAEETGSSDEQVDAMLKGVSWVTLHDNAQQWFGVHRPGQVAYDGIVDAVEGAIEILIDAGDFSRNPLPDEDPYRILHSNPVEQLYLHGVGNARESTDAEPTESLARVFQPLSDDAWDALREIGTLKVRPITFQSGTAQLSLPGKKELDKAAANLKRYPNFRVVIKGHTGLRGDAEANRALSQTRAEAVARYLEVTFGVDTNRLRAVGKGSSEPLERKAGESSRTYNYRLPRVEMYLATEVY